MFHCLLVVAAAWPSSALHTGGKLAVSGSPVSDGFLVVETSSTFGKCVKKRKPETPKLPPKKGWPGLPIQGDPGEPGDANSTMPAVQDYMNTWLGEGGPAPEPGTAAPGMPVDPTMADVEDSTKKWRSEGAASEKSSTMMSGVPVGLTTSDVDMYANRWLGEGNMISGMPVNPSVPNVENYLKNWLSEGKAMPRPLVTPTAQGVKYYAKQSLANPALSGVDEYVTNWLGEGEMAPVMAAGRSVPDVGSQTETPKLTDFSGDWILVWIDGDMNKMLSKIGIGSSMMPLFGGQLNYGVGLLVQKINQTGDDFTVESKMLGTSYSEAVAYRIGQLEESKDSRYCATWANPDHTEILYDESRQGVHVPRYSRYMNGDMMMMWIDIEGVEITQYWARYKGTPYKGNADEVSRILQTMEYDQHS